MQLRISTLSSLALLTLVLAGRADDAATGFVDTPGGKLWYEARGQGEPMVLIHDGLLPSETWDGQVAPFAKAYRVVRYDRRGYGRSEMPRGEYSDVDDLHAVIEHLKLEPAILVGCSHGGSVAVDYALAHPERVKALVLAGPVVSGLPYSEHFSRRGVANYRPVFRGQGTVEAVESWVRDPYLTAPGNAGAKARLRELMTRYPGSALGSIPEGRQATRPAIQHLSEIHQPTLIVVGASDIPDVHAHAGALEAGIAGARRVVIPGAGHLVHFERPEVFNELVLTFLRPQDAAAAYLKGLDVQHGFAAGKHLLDYDASAPLDVRETGTERRGEVRVIDLTYASPHGGRVPAYLVLPAGAGRRPAVLYLHPGQGDRSTFLDEAVELARDHGYVGLTLSAPFLRPEVKARENSNPWDPERSRDEQIQTILDLRRGLDLLVARPEVDPRRLAYVGHSLGATVGGAFAGVDKRPVAHVLMAGYPSLTHASAEGHLRGGITFQELLTAEQQKAFVDALAPIDSVYFVGHAAPAKLLFQFARRDEYIEPWDAAVYVQAASDPKEVKWYDTGHFFDDAARQDRVAWLTAVLGPAPAR